MTERVLQVLEDTARERLAALVPAVDSVGRASAAVARSRARRRAVAVGSVTVSVVLALVVATETLPRLGAEPVPPTGPQVVVPEVTGTTVLGGKTWPVAGALTADDGFVRAAGSALAGQHEEVTGSPFRPEIVFADDVDAFRLVVGRDAEGETALLCGPRGAAVASMHDADCDPAPRVGPYAYTTRIGDPAGPVVVLLPDGGAGERLLVLAPSGVSVDVARSQAVWPETAPRFQELQLPAGIGLVPFEPDAPFTASQVALAARGRSGSSALAATVIAVGFDNSYTSSSSQGWGDGLDPQTAETVGMAAAQAHYLAGIEYAFVVTVLGTAALPDDVRLAVVEDVEQGIRSRAMELTVGADTSYVAETQVPVLSQAAVVDPRPLVLLDVYGPSGDPLSVVWAGGSDRVVRYVSDAGASGERTRSVTSDRDGFVTVSARTVTVLSVRTTTGAEIWAGAAP